MTNICPKCQHANPDDTLFCGKCGTQFPSPEEVKVTETIEAPKEELTTGSTFARRYQIIEELGKGGMGKVYKAHDTEIKEKVALKLIKPEISADKKTIERFQNELKFARKISHRNVCRMYDLNKEEGSYYITMEYVSGEDLKSFIRRVAPISIPKAISIAVQVCEGLEEAHSLGVVHRDLKPSNIMIDKNGNARIMDFGIARSTTGKGITDKGIMIGTPEYMSPEQVEGKEIDQRSDIYSLGVILYEMLTGRVPFDGDTPFTIGVKHKSEMPENPKELNTLIPDDLNNVILKCLEKEKEKRYQNAREVCSELTNIEKGIPITERMVPERSPITSKEITVTFATKKLIIPALLVIVIAVVGFLIWHPWSLEETFSAVSGKSSIAVLPFEDLSPQKDQGYLCDGFAESLINALTKIEDLRVPAPTSSFSFREKEIDLKEVGEKLNIKNVLRGSVQKAGKRVRIIAQLINVADDSILWSEQYNRELNDIFSIQDEISLAIADSLKLKLMGEEKSKLTKRYTDDVEAYSFYLKGRFFWNKRTEEGFKKAIEYFEQAIEEDSNFALAYTGLADTYSMFSTYDIFPKSEVLPKARSMAKKAAELDDMLSEAHNSMAWVKLEEWNWDESEREFNRAIELNPNYATAHHWYAWALTFWGRFDEAIREIGKAYELDPLSIVINRDIGKVYQMAHMYDEAIEALKKTIEMNPEFSSTHIYLGEAYLHRLMYKNALAEFQIEDARAHIGIVYYRMGMRERSYEILNELITQEYLPYDIARLCIVIGEIDQGFQYLEKAYQRKDFNLANCIKSDPLLDIIRSDPRFKDLLRRMNLE